LESRYRRSQYRDYGGRTWCNVLIALGDVDGLIVSLVNDIVHTRRALATTQGSGTRSEAARVPRLERPGPIFGLNHEVSKAKIARQYAKRLDAKLKYQDVMWNSLRHSCCLPYIEWQELRRQADQAWNIAEWLSYESGHAFKDRCGVWRLNEPRDMVGLALRCWCEQKGVAYS
jgi:hypothetical protein